MPSCDLDPQMYSNFDFPVCHHPLYPTQYVHLQGLSMCIRPHTHCHCKHMKYICFVGKYMLLFENYGNYTKSTPQDVNIPNKLFFWYLSTKMYHPNTTTLMVSYLNKIVTCCNVCCRMQQPDKTSDYILIAIYKLARQQVIICCIEKRSIHGQII